MVVEAPPVIPGHEKRGIIPVTALHKCVSDTGDVVLSAQRCDRWVIGLSSRGSDPGHTCYFSCLHIFNKLAAIANNILRISCIEWLDEVGGVPDRSRAIITPAYTCAIQLLRYVGNVIASIGPVAITSSSQRVKNHVLR